MAPQQERVPYDPSQKCSNNFILAVDTLPWVNFRPSGVSHLNPHILWKLKYVVSHGVNFYGFLVTGKLSSSWDRIDHIFNLCDSILLAQNPNA